MSATWDLRKLQQTLERKSPGPLYFVYGEETFMFDEALKTLKIKALEQGAADFNYDCFFAGDASASHVRDTAEMLPMMSPKRVVVYKNIEEVKEKEWEVLFPILENPVESTVLILVAEKVDKRKKFFKKISENGIVVEMKRPYENQMPMWVEYIAQKNDVEISREAVQMMIQFVGNNLSEIQNEMGKLRSFIGERNKIEAEDVLKSVSHSRIENVFDLANAIGRADRAQALTCLAHLLEQGQNEVGALAMISRHIRILATLNEGQKEGLTGMRLSARAGIPQFFLKDYMDQARTWSEQKIRKTMHALHDTDKAMKSSPVSAHIWLENFIINVAT